MAAIDIDMSEFTQKTTLASTDFITGTLADGSAVKIKVSDIATVVAGMNVQTNTHLCSGGIYESVDLGLPSGTLWAKYNVGATSETDYGDLFAWGATDPYRLNGSIPIDNTDNYAKSYANTIQHDLYPNEDVATVKWGKGWCMPTKAQFQELKNNTDGGVWTSISGINGYKFTSSNGNYVFLPASGVIDGLKLESRSAYGIYHSSTVYSTTNAWGMRLIANSLIIYGAPRNYGSSIRPVRKK